MLVPIQTYMALTHLKQQQQQQQVQQHNQATPPSSSPSSTSADKDKEVVQLDGTFPKLGGGSGGAGMECEGKGGASPFRSRSGVEPGIVQLDGGSGGGGPPVESSSDDDSDMDEDSSEVRGQGSGCIVHSLCACVGGGW